MLKRLRTFSMLFLAVISHSAYSAQLIDSIPTELTQNWRVCINYETRAAVCETKVTPAIQQEIKEAVRSFVYKKDFIISSQLQRTTLGIWLNVVDDVDEVKINGKLVGKLGHFPPQYESAFRHKRLYVIPSIYLNYNQFNHLEIKTFSSINQPGLGKKPILLGEYFQIAQYQQELDYIYLICVVVLLLLTLFQMFYYFMIKGSNETIFLSMSLVSFAVIAFLRSDAPLHIGLNLSAAFKVEFFMLSFSFIALSLFALRFFELRLRHRYIIASVIAGIPGILAILYPNPLHIRYIFETGYIVMGTAEIFMLISIIIFSIQKKRKYSSAMAALLGSICLGICFDAFSQTKAIFNWQLPILPFFLPFVVASASIGMALTITHKYWQVFKGATYDNLTGTLLRPAFFQRLTDEMHRCQIDKSGLMLAVINMEEVKDIGVSYGRIARNKTLTLVSEKIVSSLEPSDLVCHFNDDEFCISTNIESKQQAENQLRNLHRALLNTQQLIGKDTEFYVSSKIAGVIYNPDRHLSISQLIQDANFGLSKLESEGNGEFILIDNPVINL